MQNGIFKNKQNIYLAVFIINYKFQTFSIRTLFCRFQILQHQTPSSETLSKYRQLPQSGPVFIQPGSSKNSRTV